MLLRTALLWIFCHGLVILLSPNIWRSVLNGYSGDSFWTLTAVGKLGVLTISLSGLILIALLNRWKTRSILRRTQYRWPVPVWAFDCALGVAFFGVIYVMSPQIFYTFYQYLIPSLPNQWVIDNAAKWEGFVHIIVPRSGGSLADHLAGVAIGGTILFTTALHLQRAQFRSRD